eukprot:2959178-Rhodomonas_salina.1
MKAAALPTLATSLPSPLRLLTLWLQGKSKGPQNVPTILPFPSLPTPAWLPVPACLPAFLPPAP